MSATKPPLPARPAPGASVEERTVVAAELSLPESFVAGVAARVAELLDERSAGPEPWLDVAGAADHLCCPKSRIYALTSAGRLPCQRDGTRLLFRASELDAWVEGGGGSRP